MIDVYFVLRGMNNCVGAVSLKEYNSMLGANVWELYGVFPITNKTIMFKRDEKEFCVTDGYMRHEMGQIKFEYVDGKWLHINIIEL